MLLFTTILPQWAVGFERFLERIVLHFMPEILLQKYIPNVGKLYDSPPFSWATFSKESKFIVRPVK